MEGSQARRLGEEVGRVEETANRLREQAADPNASDDDVIAAADEYMSAIGARNAAFDRAQAPTDVAALGERESGRVEDAAALAEGAEAATDHAGDRGPDAKFNVGDAVLVDQAGPGRVAAVEYGQVPTIVGEDLTEGTEPGYVYTITPDEGGDPWTGVPEFNLMDPAAQLADGEAAGSGASA